MRKTTNPPKTVAKRRQRRHQAVTRRSRASVAARDDTEIIALKLKPAKLTPAMAAYFKLCEEKLGFVPNVLKAFAFDMTKLEAFVAYRNDLMQGESGLSKLEREMIATAVSAQNRCYYCITAHGASVRYLSGDPVLGELMVDELSRGAARQAPARHARFRGEAHGRAVGGRGRGPRAAAARPASPTATSGTSPRSPPSTT